MDVGAGPCGTLARDEKQCRRLQLCQNSHSAVRMTSSITWMLANLWPHLVEYYATRPPNPFMKLGAKRGGGHGKTELWNRRQERTRKTIW